MPDLRDHVAPTIETRPARKLAAEGRACVPCLQTNDIDAHAAMWHEYEGEDAEERAEQAVLDQQIRLEQERRQLSERLAAEAAVKKGAGHASEGVGDQLGQRAAQERAAAGLTTLARVSVGSVGDGVTDPWRMGLLLGTRLGAVGGLTAAEHCLRRNKRPNSKSSQRYLSPLVV